MNGSDAEELDHLVARLRNAAATLDAEEPPIGPPIGAWYRQLAELRDRHESPFPLRDPDWPTLAELLAYDRDDDAFLEGLYRHLLGRDIDPEGRDYYHGELQRMGRLHVLGCLVQAEEGARHRQRQGVGLPASVGRLVRAQRLVRRLGPLQAQGFRVLRRLLASVTRRYRQRWALDAALCRLLASASAWQGERQTLASAVLEMEDRQQQLGRRQDHEYARLQALSQQVAVLRRQHLPQSAQAVQAAETAAPPPSELDAYYLAFEAAFRGPEADIAAHLDHYRSDWTRARQAGKRALDLGCGRGEWLHLLHQAGFDPHGIDLNVTMVAHCQEQGFEVRQADALAALREQPDASHALISGFHIAEHLPFEVLFALVAEANRVLLPGGVLILETPNPENLIVASYSFYHDLTHRNPLTPLSLEFLLQFHGFTDTVIRRFNPPPEATRLPGEGAVVERLNAMLAAPMDYAVVGTKAGQGRA